MRVSDLFEKVDPSVQKTVPTKLISAVYKQFTVDSKAKLRTHDGPFKAEDAKSGIYFSLGSGDLPAAIGYAPYRHGPGGTYVGIYLTPEDKVETFSNDSLSKVIAKISPRFKRGTLYYVKTSGWAPTRYADKLGASESKSSVEQSSILSYMNEIFLPKFKEEAEEYLDFIFYNLKNLPDGPKMWTYDKTDRQRALEAAGKIEALIKNGFNKDTVMDFLRSKNMAHYGFGSHWTNIYQFVSYFEDEPAAKAKFAQNLFKTLRAIHKEVADNVKEAKRAKAKAVKESALVEGVDTDAVKKLQDAVAALKGIQKDLVAYDERFEDTDMGGVGLFNTGLSVRWNSDDKYPAGFKPMVKKTIETHIAKYPSLAGVFNTAKIEYEKDLAETYIECPFNTADGRWAPEIAQAVKKVKGLKHGDLSGL